MSREFCPDCDIDMDVHRGLTCAQAVTREDRISRFYGAFL